jgi:cytochrome c
MKHTKTASALMFAAMAAGVAFAAVADDSSDSGRRIFVQRCQTCHGVTAEADSALGPNLKGVFGRKAGGGDSGVHSRAAIESDTVWTRSSMRRYLSEPGREMPGTLMQGRVTDGRELDDLLNYLETLR